MTRRAALSLLSTLPFAVRAAAQSSPSGARGISINSATYFVLEPDGTVKGWCENPNGVNGGSLGLGSDDHVGPYVAHPIPSLRNVVTLASSSYATFALLAEGSIVSWGSRSKGALGITPLPELEATAEPHPDAIRPTPVIGIADAIDVVSHGDHVLALARNGTVYAWGSGAFGQLGIGPMPIVTFKTHAPSAPDFLPYPVRIPNLTDVAAIAAGDTYSLALMKDGTVRAWGGNRWGQLGDGTVIDRRTPVVVPGIRTAKAIAANDQLSAAVLADGTVMTWGLGNSALARRTVKQDTPYPTPALVEGVAGIRSVAMGSTHMLALTDSGTVISWGDSNVGEVGHTGTAPQRIPGLTSVQSIEAYTGHSYAVLANGGIMTWGGVPLWARVDGGTPGVSHTPIPLVIKGLRNPAANL